MNFNQSLESYLQKNIVKYDRIFKRTLKIGFLPETMIIQFLEFFMKGLPFNDKNRKVLRIMLIPDPDSVLREQIAIIEFKEDYFYTQAIASLMKKVMAYQQIMYNIECPSDK